MHVSSVTWSELETDVGSTVKLKATLVDVTQPTTIEFVIEEYSGQPPPGSGSEDGPIIDRGEVNVDKGATEAEWTWTVILPPESAPARGGVPELRARARPKDRGDVGPASKLLTFGAIESLAWEVTTKRTPQPKPPQLHQVYYDFSEDDRLALVLKGRRLVGFAVDFEIVRRDGTAVDSVRGVPIRGGVARAEWNPSPELRTTLGDVDLRFTVALRHDAGSAPYVPSKPESQLAGLVWCELLDDARIDERIWQPLTDEQYARLLDLADRTRDKSRSTWTGHKHEAHARTLFDRWDFGTICSRFSAAGLSPILPIAFMRKECTLGNVANRTSLKPAHIGNPFSYHFAERHSLKSLYKVEPTGDIDEDPQIDKLPTMDELLSRVIVEMTCAGPGASLQTIADVCWKPADRSWVKDIRAFCRQLLGELDLCHGMQWPKTLL